MFIMTKRQKQVDDSLNQGFYIRKHATMTGSVFHLHRPDNNHTVKGIGSKSLVPFLDALEMRKVDAWPSHPGVKIETRYYRTTI